MNQLNLKAIRPCLVLGSCLATYGVVQGTNNMGDDEKRHPRQWMEDSQSTSFLHQSMPLCFAEIHFAKTTCNLKPLKVQFFGLQQRTGRFQVFPGLLMESASRVLNFFARNVWCLFSCTQIICCNMIHVYISIYYTYHIISYEYIHIHMHQYSCVPRSKLKLLILGMVVPRLVRNPYNGFL